MCQGVRYLLHSSAPVESNSTLTPSLVLNTADSSKVSEGSNFLMDSTSVGRDLPFYFVVTTTLRGNSLDLPTISRLSLFAWHNSVL